jgi:hypothetical protein
MMDEMSRQVRRARERALFKTLRREAAHKLRRAKARALSERQARREKSGFYYGKLSVAAALSSKRAGRLHRRVLIDDTAKARHGNLQVLG